MDRMSSQTLSVQGNVRDLTRCCSCHGKASRIIGRACKADKADRVVVWVLVFQVKPKTFHFAVVPAELSTKRNRSPSGEPPACCSNPSERDVFPSTGVDRTP